MDGRLAETSSIRHAAKQSKTVPTRLRLLPATPPNELPSLPLPLTVPWRWAALPSRTPVQYQAVWTVARHTDAGVAGLVEDIAAFTRGL